MEILALIIPAIVVALYVRGQENVQSLGDDIMRARDQRIADRESEYRNLANSPYDIIAENGNEAMRRDGTMVSKTDLNE